VAKNGNFYSKTFENAKNTPLRSVLIFDFNSNENQNLFKNSKISKIRRYKERRNNATKIQRNKDSKKRRKIYEY
jgi:predicted 3-demethylubiquinone-9 3-methyltransferase (glyoxalase superfamily)